MAPIGDDIEPIGVSRADVEMRSDEDGRTLGSRISQSQNECEEFHEKRENKNMKIQDILCAGVGVLLVSKVEVLVDNIELNCWRMRREKERLRL